MSCKSLEKHYHINGKLLDEQYAAHLSDFTTWDQGEHADNYIIFPKNLGPHLSIDETSLSQGELYTVLTNKEAKGRSGALVAMIKGTDSLTVSTILLQIPASQRKKVKEVTLDMAGSMEKIVKNCFPKSQQVTDRFHVQKLASDCVQELRIKYRWQAIEQENNEMDLAKESGNQYKADRLDNGDTFRQLLARSRYLLFKDERNWTPTQVHRAEILFKYYPEIKKAYKLSRELANIYTKTKNKGVAFTKLAQWYNQIEQSGIKSFNTVKNSIQHHYNSILNYFDNRSTNASAESFNAKIKAFRAQFRGVRNVNSYTD